MTLPQATRLDITAPMPSSYAEIISAKRDRERRWEEQALRAAPKPKAAEPAIRAPKIVMRLPAPPLRLVQHDRHVAAYYEWMGNEPLGFIKLKCREIGVSFAEITMKSRMRAIVKPRQHLICEVKKKFPNLSLPQIGRLFGGFDHTTILHALKIGGIHTAFPRRTAETERANIYRLVLAGKSYSEIAHAVGFSKPAVASVIRRNGWCGHCRPQRIADNRDEVKRMFDDGATFAQMARVLGFDDKNISYYVKRQGWTRSQSKPRADNR